VTRLGPARSGDEFIHADWKPRSSDQPSHRSQIVVPPCSSMYRQDGHERCASNRQATDV
jgi:hypothetical protein